MIVSFRPILVVCGSERVLLSPFETHWDRDFLLSCGIPRDRCINIEVLTAQRLRAKSEINAPDDADVFLDRDITDWDGSLLRKPTAAPCEWDEAVEPGDRVEYRPLTTIVPDIGDLGSKETKPHWDDDLKQLSYGTVTFKRYRKNAWSQWPILQAFEAAEWRHRIENPLDTDDPKRLSDTVSDLNKRVRGTLRFEMDGEGKGVVWQVDTQDR